MYKTNIESILSFSLSLSVFAYVSLNARQCKAKTVSNSKTVFCTCPVFFQTFIYLFIHCNRHSELIPRQIPASNIVCSKRFIFQNSFVITFKEVAGIRVYLTDKRQWAILCMLIPTGDPLNNKSLFPIKNYTKKKNQLPVFL